MPLAKKTSSIAVRRYAAAGPSGNSVVDGGNGTWNASNTNWTNFGGAASGTSSGTWPGNTNTAYFRGNAGTVTIANGYTANVGRLSFETDGYMLSGTVTLVPTQDANGLFSGETTLPHV